MISRRTRFARVRALLRAAEGTLVLTPKPIVPCPGCANPLTFLRHCRGHPSTASKKWVSRIVSNTRRLSARCFQPFWRPPVEGVTPDAAAAAISRKTGLRAFLIPKISLTGASTERVDTRVLQVIYTFKRPETPPIYVGQQVDVFIEAENDPAAAGVSK